MPDARLTNPVARVVGDLIVTKLGLGPGDIDVTENAAHLRTMLDVNGTGDAAGETAHGQTITAATRLPLDPIFQQAANQDDHPERLPVPPDPDTPTPEIVQEGPDVILGAEPDTAPPEGVTLPTS
jgi:hypothetical protein